MNASPEINTTQTVTFTVAPSMCLAAELREMTITGEFERLPGIVKDEYAWYVPQHKRLALEFAEAAVLADQMLLQQQVILNAQQMIYFLTKDLAEHTHALARYRLGYKGEITIRQYSIDARRSFDDLVKSTKDRRVAWVFKPIDYFDKLIPLHALKAAKTLAEAGIVPETYWVADKIEVVIPKPLAVSVAPISRSLDPILCAQFGSWMVGIAWWL